MPTRRLFVSYHNKKSCYLTFSKIQRFTTNTKSWAHHCHSVCVLVCRLRVKRQWTDSMYMYMYMYIVRMYPVFSQKGERGALPL